MPVTKKLKISLVPSVRLMHFYLQIQWFLPGRALAKGFMRGWDHHLSSVAPLALGVLEELLLGTGGGEEAEIGVFPAV